MNTRRVVLSHDQIRTMFPDSDRELVEQFFKGITREGEIPDPSTPEGDVLVRDLARIFKTASGFSSFVENDITL